MGDHVVEIADAATQVEISAIAPGLRSVNTETTGINDRRQIAVLLRDRVTGGIAGGGLTGRTLLTCCRDILPAARVSRFMHRKPFLEPGETESRRRGGSTAILPTTAFQAQGFYENNGWTSFGEVECDLPCANRFFMTKRL